MSGSFFSMHQNKQKNKHTTYKKMICLIKSIAVKEIYNPPTQPTDYKFL